MVGKIENSDTERDTTYLLYKPSVPPGPLSTTRGGSELARSPSEATTTIRGFSSSIN